MIYFTHVIVGLLFLSVGIALGALLPIRKPRILPLSFVDGEEIDEWFEADWQKKWKDNTAQIDLDRALDIFSEEICESIDRHRANYKLKVCIDAETSRTGRDISSIVYSEVISRFERRLQAPDGVLS